MVQDVLKDQAFVQKYLGDQVGEREILFEDPELGFCILAHHYQGARASNPHDHGPYWAIYGQAEGETIMSDFSLPRARRRGQARQGAVREELFAQARHGACL